MPVSSQATPRPITSHVQLAALQIGLLRSVISSSPRAEGCSALGELDPRSS